VLYLLTNLVIKVIAGDFNAVTVDWRNLAATLRQLW